MVPDPDYNPCVLAVDPGIRNFPLSFRHCPSRIVPNSEGLGYQKSFCKLELCTQMIAPKPAIKGSDIRGHHSPIESPPSFASADERLAKASQREHPALGRPLQRPPAGMGPNPILGLFWGILEIGAQFGAEAFRTWGLG